MSIVRPVDRQRGRLATGLALAVLVLAACQAAASPSNGSPLASASASASASAPSAEPSASPAPPVLGDAGEHADFAELRAVAFANGDVLVVGNAQDAALWDAASGSWSEVAGFDKRRTHFALVRLLDDRAMVIGGMNDIDQSYLSALVFDSDGARRRVGEDRRPAPHCTHRSVGGGPGRWSGPCGGRLLPDGTGRRQPGIDGDCPGEFGWTAGRRHAAQRRRGPGHGRAVRPRDRQMDRHGAHALRPLRAPATLLANGQVLVAASQCTGDVTVDSRVCTTAEIYDPVTGSFELAGSLPDMDWSGYDFPHEQDMVRQYPLALTGSLVPLSDGGAAPTGTSGGVKYGGVAIRSFRDFPARLPDIADLYLHYWNPCRRPMSRSSSKRRMSWRVRRRWWRCSRTVWCSLPAATVCTERLRPRNCTTLPVPAGRLCHRCPMRGRREPR